MVPLLTRNTHKSKQWQYTYAYPAPEGFRDYSIQPREAFYSSQMQEFILPYEAVRQADDPDAVLLAFFQSTYEAAANLGHWERAALECTLALQG